VSKSLAGRNILVTRPAHQARHLAEKIHLAGGHPVLFPVLEIQDTANPGLLQDLIRRLDEFDLAIFISPNAVNKAMTQISAMRPLPAKLKVAAVGQGTSRALAHFGVDNVIAPAKRFDSEALLEVAELREVADKRVVIFRGDGGRELLGDTLRKRSAMVEYVECYRRVKPEVDITPLLRMATSGSLDAITITSSEGLRNFCEMVGDVEQVWFKKATLFVSHERIAHTANTLGFTDVILTAPGDDGLLEGMSNYFRSRANAENSVSSR
jgi:uroporphyrinogen-III synthase